MNTQDPQQAAQTQQQTTDKPLYIPQGDRNRVLPKERIHQIARAAGVTTAHGSALVAMSERDNGDGEAVRAVVNLVDELLAQQSQVSDEEIAELVRLDQNTPRDWCIVNGEGRIYINAVGPEQIAEMDWLTPGRARLVVTARNTLPRLLADRARHAAEVERLRAALRRMCEYANHLGNEVLPPLGDASYSGDFVRQHAELLGEAAAQKGGE